MRRAAAGAASWILGALVACAAPLHDVAGPDFELPGDWAVAIPCESSPLRARQLREADFHWSAAVEGGAVQGSGAASSAASARPGVELGGSQGQSWSPVGEASVLSVRPRLAVSTYPLAWYERELPGELAVALESQPWIRIIPELEEMARKATGTTRDATAAARALAAWVAEAVELREDDGRCRASQVVLAEGEGSALEHAVLLTAMIRARGIPARPVLGLRFADGALRPWAWVEVWTGEWWPLDSTHPGLTVDAARIAVLSCTQLGLPQIRRFLQRVDEMRAGRLELHPRRDHDGRPVDLPRAMLEQDRWLLRGLGVSLHLPEGWTARVGTELDAEFGADLGARGAAELFAPGAREPCAVLGVHRDSLGREKLELRPADAEAEPVAGEAEVLSAIREALRAPAPAPAGAPGQSAAGSILHAPVLQAGATVQDFELDYGPWIPLFDGQSLDGWKPTDLGGGVEPWVRDGRLMLDIGEPMSGVTFAGNEALALEDLPRADYELELRAARTAGTDFFVGLTFPVGDQHLSFIAGGWGGSLVGLSSLDGDDAARNETCQYHRFDQGVPATFRLRVRAQRVQVWRDGAPLLDVDLHGREVSLRAEVLPSTPLGLASFVTRSEISAVRLRTFKE